MNRQPDSRSIDGSRPACCAPRAESLTTLHDTASHSRPQDSSMNLPTASTDSTGHYQGHDNGCYHSYHRGYCHRCYEGYSTGLFCQDPPPMQKGVLPEDSGFRKGLRCKSRLRSACSKDFTVQLLTACCCAWCLVPCLNMSACKAACVIGLIHACDSCASHKHTEHETQV